jgi:hypothetical protein
LTDVALKRARGHEGLPDLPEILQRLEEARHLAMAVSRPGDAVAATMAQARLLGFDIARSAIAIGAPQEFQTLHGDVEQEQQRAIEGIRERWGSRAAGVFQKLVADMRGDGDDTIEGEIVPDE